MAIKKTLEERIKSRARAAWKAQLAYERAYEREIDKDIQQFRAETANAYKMAEPGQRPRSILAEGDSWARYMIGKAIPFHLPKIDARNRVMNVASPGHTAAEMLTGNAAKKLGQRIKRGPGKNRKFDVIYFSGGGNDLLGNDRFANFLNRYQSGMTPAQIVNSGALNAAFRELAKHYTTLVQLRDDNSPNTLIYFNAYDFAYPTGEPACGFLGPWLKPHLEDCGAPPSLWLDVVALFLRRYKTFLDKFAATAGSGLVVLGTQGTLNKESDWDNEIHPKDPPFRRLAQVVQLQLVKDFP